MTDESQIETALGRMVLAGLTPMRVLGAHPPHFQLDQDHRLLLIPARDVSARWEFRLSKSMIALLRSATLKNRSLLDQWSLALICGEDLCFLYEAEWIRLIDEDRIAEQKLFVRRPQNCSFRVWSEMNVLQKTAPLNRFSTLANAA